MKVRLLKKGLCLFPIDKDSEAYLKRASDNDFFEIDIVKKRNPRFHRKYFSMLDVVAKQFDVNIEDMHDFVKEKLGLYTIVSVGKCIFKRYHSISFAKMDEIEFEEYYDNSLRVLSDLLGLDYAELVTELSAEYG